MTQQPAGTATPPVLGYQTSCPLDGSGLRLYAGPPTHAPWVCLSCRHSWWGAELTTAARRVFRPAVVDFGYDGTVARAVGLEVAAAVVVGHNVPAAALTPAVMTQLKAAGLSS